MMKFAASQYKVNIMRPSFFVVGSKFYSTGSSLTGGRRSLCDEKLTPFLFLKGFFFVSSLHLCLGFFYITFLFYLHPDFSCFSFYFQFYSNFVLQLLHYLEPLL